MLCAALACLSFLFQGLRGEPWPLPAHRPRPAAWAGCCPAPATVLPPSMPATSRGQLGYECARRMCGHSPALESSGSHTSCVCPLRCFCGRGVTYWSRGGPGAIPSCRGRKGMSSEAVPLKLGGCRCWKRPDSESPACCPLS